MSEKSPTHGLTTTDAVRSHSEGLGVSRQVDVQATCGTNPALPCL
jgi:hypothetical protein